MDQRYEESEGAGTREQLQRFCCEKWRVANDAAAKEGKEPGEIREVETWKFNFIYTKAAFPISHLRNMSGGQ